MSTPTKQPLAFLPGPDALVSVRIGREQAWGNATFNSIVWTDRTAALRVDTGAANLVLSTDAVQLHALSELLTDTLAAMRSEVSPSDEYAAIERSLNTAKAPPTRDEMRELIARIGWLASDMNVEGAQAVTDHLDAAYEALGRCHADSADDGPLQADQRLDMAERAR